MKRKKLQHLSLLLCLVYFLNLCFPCILVKAESTPSMASLVEAVTSSASFTEVTEGVSFDDIAGHWAEKAIKAWGVRQLVGGYPDDTFRPNAQITRAEFLTLINRAFGYKAAGNVNYQDVKATDWFFGEIAKAVAVGYLSGYPDGTVKPQSRLTRQEAAALFAKILPPSITSATSNQKTQFVDQAQIPVWSQAAIAAAVSSGYMSGYPDGTFQPARPITRAEAISVLDRAVGTLYNRAGTYDLSQEMTILEGNVTINTPNITLKNIIITGNLYLTEGIGEGEVTLDNVTVQGTTKISGGGINGIHLINTTVGYVLVHVPNRNLVRLVAQGRTTVGRLEARTPVRLEEIQLTSAGFTNVIINAQEETTIQGLKPEFKVELLGEFASVKVQAPAVQLDLPKGVIQNLTLTPTARDSKIKLTARATIKNLITDTSATVQGQGIIRMAQINVDGVIIDAPVTNILLEDGVKTIVKGRTITKSIKDSSGSRRKSNDAALSDLTIDGTTITGFAADTFTYEVILAAGTERVPTVAATAHHAKAIVAVTQATEVNGSATVLVTAENGITLTYTVNFAVVTVAGIAVKTAPTKTTYLQGVLLTLPV